MIGPQIGSSIHLPPNWENDYNPDPMSSNVLYRSISDTDTYMTIPNFDFSPDNGEFVSAHRIDGYVEKLVKMLYTGSDPLETNGYISGTQCQSDIECKSFTSGTGGGCTNNVCADTQPDNNRCRDRSDCATGRCDLTWSGILECQEKKSKGSMCNEDSDCSSGVCSWLWTCK